MNTCTTCCASPSVAAWPRTACCGVDGVRALRVEGVPATDNQRWWVALIAARHRDVAQDVAGA